MAEETLVQTCRVADFDAVTGVCSAPFYSAPQGPFPPLSIDDANAILMAAALLLGTAWSLKMIRRALNEIG